MQTMIPIKSYAKTYIGRMLSNFFMCQVFYLGFNFPSSEHAYQSAKMFILRCYSVSDRIRHDSRLSVMQVKRMAREAAKAIEFGDNYERRLFRHWRTIRADVMFAVLYNKFDQNAELRNALVSTGDVWLVEAGDAEWGVDISYNELFEYRYTFNPQSWYGSYGTNILGSKLELIRSHFQFGRRSPTALFVSDSMAKGIPHPSRYNPRCTVRFALGGANISEVLRIVRCLLIPTMKRCGIMVGTNNLSFGPIGSAQWLAHLGKNTGTALPKPFHKELTHHCENIEKVIVSWPNTDFFVFELIPRLCDERPGAENTKMKNAVNNMNDMFRKATLNHRNAYVVELTRSFQDPLCFEENLETVSQVDLHLSLKGKENLTAVYDGLFWR